MDQVADGKKVLVVSDTPEIDRDMCSIYTATRSFRVVTWNDPLDDPLDEVEEVVILLPQERFYHLRVLQILKREVHLTVIGDLTDEERFDLLMSHKPDQTAQFQNLGLYLATL